MQTARAHGTEPVEAFLQAATWHGNLDRAAAMLTSAPHLARASIHTAAVLGDEQGVRDFLARDPAGARALAPPYQGSPLVYLCLSKYLRLESPRSAAFVQTATALLDAGADPDQGFWTDPPHPEYETPLYGAAGVAAHRELTLLLLARGADPNDAEVVYHSPEGYELGAMMAVVETGRLTPDSLMLMLLRKHDWHDEAGVKYLLEHGADPNRTWRHGRSALQHGISRDNSLAIIELALDHGGDPGLVRGEISGTALAARRGRGDLLALFQRRGFDIELAGPDRLIVACALDDGARVRAIARHEPELVQLVIAQGGTLLAEFAGTGNSAGVGHLLDLGVPIDAPYSGDAYFDIPPDSTALHVAAWRAHHGTVRLLLERGAPVNPRDRKARTPLMAAVRTCVDSYWTYRRSPESVALLLEAGVSTEGVSLPTGYDDVDRLIQGRRTARPHA
jgi:ankyrin repeat protein